MLKHAPLIFISFNLFAHNSLVLFDPCEVELVEDGHNLLFRGPIPRDLESNFCLDKLLESFSPLPETYNLILFSLLTKERQEEVFFMKKLHEFFSPLSHSQENLIMKAPNYNPLVGIFYWWQVRAHLKSIGGGYQAVTKQVFANIPLEFPKLIETIANYMEEENDIPNVIYVHCRHGVNRTSAVMIGYEMYTKGTCFEKAWEIHTQNKPLFDANEMRNFLKLYEEYLSETSAR
ncbi:MAG: hypothetical protein SP1CHLAM54_08100 [Chlamydiia bacterium]|nr:hypothetical protein [Chlamydiia bacterium]MCH9615716.1 hypothetical protein [Chlamydiia bacterium]MCH9628881.1 hypothetical protein [Chlamydiia bacterium]